MLEKIRKNDLFCDYYAQWINVYKKNAIRKITMDKYLMSQKWLKKLVPHLKIHELTRIAYPLSNFASNCCVNRASCFKRPRPPKRVITNHSAPSFA